MSTVYNQHSVTSVGVGPTGHVHNRSGDAEGETPTAIDCVACEPFLVKEGWVYNPNLVPLTDQQVMDRERADREGNQAVRWAAEAQGRAAQQAIAAAHRQDDDEPQQIVVMAPPVETPKPETKAEPVETKPEPEPKAKATPKTETAPKAAAKTETPKAKATAKAAG